MIHTQWIFSLQKSDIKFKPVWLPVDKHWIGNVWIFVDEGKPNIYADIDKLVH